MIKVSEVSCNRVISRSALRNSAIALRRAILIQRAPLYVHMKDAVGFSACLLHSPEEGDLLGVYNEFASVGWMEADLYWYAFSKGGALFII